MKRISLSCLLMVSMHFLVTGQEISGGFKVGLNFSKFDGDVATDAQGNELETNNYATGFHVGAIINFKVTDIFGFRTELLYSQKGSDYSFDGPSYLRLYTRQGDPVITFGNRREVISFSNSYIDVPLMSYIKVGRIEASAGVNAAILLGSRGQGEITYSGVSAGGQNVEAIIIAIDGNFNQDTPTTTGFGQITTRTIDNREVGIPEVVTAYYDGNPGDEVLFNRFDLGLNAGVNVFINNGLNLGFRVNYGLTDLTNKNQDVDRTGLDNGMIRLSDDMDRNVSLQASIGFSF